MFWPSEVGIRTPDFLRFLNMIWILKVMESNPGKEVKISWLYEYQEKKLWVLMTFWIQGIHLNINFSNILLSAATNS